MFKLYFIYIERGYYTVARRYEFYFRVAQQYFIINKTIFYNKSSYLFQGCH